MADTTGTGQFWALGILVLAVVWLAWDGVDPEPPTGASVAQPREALIPSLPPLESVEPPPTTQGPLRFDAITSSASPGLSDSFVAVVPAAETVDFVVRGRVVDQMGQPLPGAGLVLVPDGRTLARLRELQGEPTADSWPTAWGSHAQTGDDGRFRITTRRLPQTFLDEDAWLLPVLMIWDPRCALFCRLVPGEQGLDVDLGDLRVTPSATLRGRVVDALGQPLAGVTVLLGANQLTDPACDWYGRFMPDDHPRAVSDAEGMYSLDRLWPARGATVSAAAEGLRRTSVQVPAWAAGATVDVPLLRTDPGLAIVVQVTDLEGQDILDARVWVRPGDSSLSSMYAGYEGLRPEDYRAAEHQGAGRYTCQGLGNERHEVLIAADGFLARSFHDVWPAPEPLLAVLDRVDAPWSVECRVTGSHGQLPPEASLEFEADSDEFVSTGCSIEPVAPGVYRVDASTPWVSVVATAPGHTTVNRWLESTDGPQRLLLQKTADVQGMVRDTAGRAVPRATVTLRAVEVPEDVVLPEDIATRCADDGSYQIEDVPPGLWAITPAPPDGEELVWRPEGADRLLLDEGQQALRMLTVVRPASLVVRMVPTDGRPLSPKLRTVELRSSPGAGIVRGDGWTWLPEHTTTDRAHFKGLFPGQYLVTGPDGDEVWATVTEGQETEVSVPVHQLASVRVRTQVVLHDRPVAGALVQIGVPEGATGEESGFLKGLEVDESRPGPSIYVDSATYVTVGETDITGRLAFDCTDVLPGLTLRALLPDGGESRTERLPVEAPEADVLLVADDLTVTVVVQDTMTGTALSGAAVRTSDRAARSTDDRGRVVYTGLSAGRPGFLVEREGYLGGRGDSQVGPGQANTLVIQLVPVSGAFLRTVLLAENGQPTQDASLCVYSREPGQPPVPAPTAVVERRADGSVVRSIAPGQYVIWAAATHPGDDIEWQDVPAYAHEIVLAPEETEVLVLPVPPP